MNAQLIERKIRRGREKLNVTRLANVVILTNYLRPHHADVLSALQSRVANLTVLLSTSMEADRKWEPNWRDLKVVVQKNWTITSRWRHSTGFDEANFIHIPYDTFSQLRRLKPDVVVSFELGMRTLACSFFCKLHGIPLIAVGNMSEAIERERGFARRQIRRFLVPRVDAFTYNGPSCKRYLESLNISADRLYWFPYYFDSSKVSPGRKEFSPGGPQRLFFSGNLTPRKGVRQMADAVGKWATAHPERNIRLRICGDGPERSQLETNWPSNLKLEFLGHSNDDQLKQSYAWADLCLFPTFADEWGLVPIEAFASGLPVVGSRAAQSIEVHGREAENGWYFDMQIPGDFSRALEIAMRTPSERLAEMSSICRETVAGISAERSADCLEKVIRAVAIQ